MVWTAATDAASGVAGYAFTVDGNPAGSCSQAQNLGPVSTATTAPLTTGTWYFHICTLDVAGNWSATVASAGPYLIDLVPPRVAGLRTVPHTGDPQLAPGETTSSGLTRLLPGFDEVMVGELEIENYHLFSGGDDGVVESSGCGAATGDDAVVALSAPEVAPAGQSPVLSVGACRDSRISPATSSTATATGWVATSSSLISGWWPRTYCSIRTSTPRLPAG